MSNHRQATDPGPSLTSIITMTAVTLAVIGLSLWIVWGSDGWRDLAGAGMGTLLAIVLMAQTVARASERAVAHERLAEHRRRGERLYGGLPDPVATQPVQWPEPIEQTNPAPEEIHPEDDRYPQSPEPVGPSPEALTQVPMPVDLGRWSTEAERQRWLDDQDTHILTRPPEWRS